jgi:hypothetical protein
MRVFATDQCLSGQCAFRETVEALLTARVLSDDKDRRAAEARAEEKLRACARLLDGEQANQAPGGSIL